MHIFNSRLHSITNQSDTYSGLCTSMSFALPSWLEPELNRWPCFLPSTEERMRLAIRLSDLNRIHKTGGPFGAIVVVRKTGEIISAGVNLVIDMKCSLLHGEAVALALAQQRLNNFDLGAEGFPELELITSSEPCCQCSGIVYWSGVWSLVTGANTADVERITGFDEGPHSDWRNDFNRLGINVQEGVLRAEACKVLQNYKDNGGYIYQGRTGSRRTYANPSNSS